MKKTVYVQWMDCISCETILRDALHDVPNIKVLSLTHKTGKLTIEYSSEKDLNKLESILKKHEYTLKDDNNHQQKRSIQGLIEQWVLWVGILVLIWAFTQIDLTQYISDYWPNMWLWVAFLVWLVACSSSCLAVTGWIIVSYIESLEDKNWFNLVKIQWLFHIWRFFAFVAWWWLLWYLWQTVQISQTVNAILMMIVWIILFYVGLQIFGIVPSITKRWFHLPWWTEKLIKKLNNPKYALIVWMLTFFLPCWFTQSMQLFAIQTWSAQEGALLLWAYALGTMPLLLWLGFSVWYFKSKMQLFNKVIGILLIVFGLMTLVNGRNASWLWTMTQSTQWEVQWVVEKLTRTHLWNRLEPKDILLQKDKSYEITINPTMNGIWCKSLINLPDWTRKRVQQGVPITFFLHPNQVGRYSLPCNMWTPHWSIVVE